jgi:carbon monoxide dehydrogenase subunit G
MATVRKELAIAAKPDYVWAAVRDVGALDRVARGVVKESRMEGDIRVIVYDNGIVVREWIVDIDDTHRRLAVTASGGRIAHLQSTVQVFPEGDEQSRVLWICDFLPNMLTDTVRDIVERATASAKLVLEKGEY